MLRSTIRCLHIMGLISSLVEKAIKIQISTKKWAGGNPQTAASRLHKKVGETETKNDAQDRTRSKLRSRLAQRLLIILVDYTEAEMWHRHIVVNDSFYATVSVWITAELCDRNELWEVNYLKFGLKYNNFKVSKEQRSDTSYYSRSLDSEDRPKRSKYIA